MLIVFLGYDNFNYLKVYGKGALDGREPLYVSSFELHVHEPKLTTQLSIIPILPGDEWNSNTPKRYWRSGRQLLPGCD